MNPLLKRIKAYLARKNQGSPGFTQIVPSEPVSPIRMNGDKCPTKGSGSGGSCTSDSGGCGPTDCPTKGGACSPTNTCLELA